MEQLPENTENFPASNANQEQQQQAGGNETRNGKEGIESEVAQEEQECHGAEQYNAHRCPGVADVIQEDQNRTAGQQDAKGFDLILIQREGLSTDDGHQNRQSDGDTAGSSGGEYIF